MFNDRIMVLLSDLAILFPAFLLVFSVRGFFKAFIAKLVGDDTAYEEGFMTINPIVHIDFLGFSLMLFFFFFLGGFFSDALGRSFLFFILILVGARWTIPVPINDRNFKDYKLGVIFTSLAGSFGNFLLALFFIYVMHYFPWPAFPKYATITLVEIFRAIVDLSIFFGVLDLIPLPPFDAAKLLPLITPIRWHYIIDWLEEYSFYIIMILFFFPVINSFFFRFLFLLSIIAKKLLLYLVF